MYTRHNLEEDLIIKYGKNSEQVATFRQLVAIYYASKEESEKKDKIIALKQEQIDYLREEENRRYSELKKKALEYLENVSRTDKWNLHKALITNLTKIIKKF